MYDQTGLGGIDFDAKGLDDTVKRGARAFAKNLPSIIALLTVFLTGAIIWTDIKIKDILTLNFALEAVMLLFIFWMMYLSMNENGMRAGKCDKGYIESRAKYQIARKKALGEGYDKLSRFCEEYRKSELERAQGALLVKGGVKKEEWERFYIEGERPSFFRKDGISLKKKYYIKRALDIKEIPITPELLFYSDGESSKRSALALTIDRARLKRNGKGLASIAATCFLVASVAVEIAEKPDSASIIYGIIKICSLLFIGFKGYMNGVLLYASDAIAFYTSRSDFLNLYFLSCWSQGEKEILVTE